MRAVLMLALAATWCAVFASGARAVTTSSFTVSGQVVTPGTYDLSALRALPAVTQTQTYQAAGTSVTDTYTGPTLWNVVQAAGGIATVPGIKNDVLRTLVVATGSDGYKAVISSGEIAPNFGHKTDQVAYADTNGALPSPDGFARVVAAGDKAGGRYVANLADLSVTSAPTVVGTGGGPTKQFTVTGGVSHALTFDLTALETLAAYSTTVTYQAAGKSVTDTYTGALLWDVLGQAGVMTDAAIKNDILRKAVVATGSDGYEVGFALGELSPKFGAEPILVAYADTLGQLGTGGPDGFARLVVPSDIAGGRYVSNIVNLDVFDATAVPEPASGALLLSGLAVLLFVSNARHAAAARRNGPTFTQS